MLEQLGDLLGKGSTKIWLYTSLLIPEDFEIDQMLKYYN